MVIVDPILQIEITFKFSDMPFSYNLITALFFNINLTVQLDASLKFSSHWSIVLSDCLETDKMSPAKSVKYPQPMVVVVVNQIFKYLSNYKYLEADKIR